MKANKFTRHLPNLITMINMLLGLLVLYLVICQKGREHRLLACFMILIAVFFDAFDGKIAKALNAESELGKQLDSFADFISFGLAPIAVLMTHSCFRDLGWIMFMCIAFYSMAGIFRLVRFNLGNFKKHFLGLPITAAGFLLILVNIILHFHAVSNRPIPVIPIIALILILAIFMVSKKKIYRLPYRKKES